MGKHPSFPVERKPSCFVTDSGKLTPIDPLISAVGTGVIATDSDIEMDRAESAPVRHVTVSVRIWLLS